GAHGLKAYASGVDSRRTLPSVTKVLAALQSLPGTLPHGLAVAVAREAVDGARARVEAGEAVTEEAVRAEACRRAAEIGRALPRGREVVVSRGELVEIGGGFRVPDVMAESGARLVEVGTTNRTRRADYERALSAETALVLRVHASNYRMIGFVESTPVAELASLGPPVVADIGSGLLDESTPWLAERPSWLRDEPGARQCLEAGAALVTFSGDKLLGGPQAGVIAGRADLVAAVSRH